MIILLTRESSIQRWCANQLADYVDSTIVEAGFAIYVEQGVTGKRLQRLAKKVLRNPVAMLGRAVKARHYPAWFGAADHDRRVLKSGYEKFERKPMHVDSVNDAAGAIRAFNPSLVLVFGTRIIRESTMAAAPQAEWVNMHWGWSPDYRAEGIVSALATGGPSHLGVTVHQLTPAVDQGDIYEQRRIDVDPQDNFYSIGLKCGMVGTAIFKALCERHRQGLSLQRQPADYTIGREYSARYMEAHPGLYRQAWRNLKG
jgi:folate-dependent phosphoribosylglycinamide formyltransferase PurN